MEAFQVQLETYAGPLDLLLYLVRRDEVPIAELPLAELTQQYLDYVAVIERVDPDAAGEFLDVASLLLQIKSRQVLPDAESAAEGSVSEEAGPIESPSDLVERLLEYKEYRDAAQQLETLRLDWSKRYTRAAPAPKGQSVADQDRPIEKVEVWDLVSAFARVMRERLEAPVEATTIFNDETPQHVHMERIEVQLRGANDRVPFEDLFPAGPVHRSTLTGVFLAMLELIRYRHALAWQEERYGPILLAAGPVPFKAMPPV